MTVQHEYTDEDLSEISGLLPYKVARTYVQLFLIYACIYLLIIFQRPHWWTLPFKADDATFLVIAGIGFLAFPLLIRRRLRGIYQRKLTAALRGEVEITVSDAGCRFKTAQTDTSLNWSIFERQVETDHFIALHVKSGGIRPFPKQAFTPQQLAELRAILVNNVHRK